MPDGSPRRRVATRTYQRTGQHFYEPLGNDTQLDMVLIPVGRFLMGSVEGEEGAYEDEYPQHEVTVPQFFLGRYPITQAQWRTVASYDQVDQKLNPDPSDFKGANRPVENVSWDDAQEFCKRLSNHTQRQYRLPSEAEWEYACRAETTTPFYFGRHISTDLANYDGSEFGDSPKGESKDQTTDVGSYPPNPWGLHDMSGNVWEWCQHDWHGSYEGAPTDSSPWLFDKSTSQEKEPNKVLRGGSWFNGPRCCRSAYRFRGRRDSRVYGIGFRVVCSPQG